jgi:hypothetical protein
MLRRRQWASVKNLRLHEPGHRPAQAVRNSESATAEVVIPVVHLNLAIILRRDQPLATKHGAGGPMLLIELQTDTVDLRRISGQLEQQTPFQCLILPTPPSVRFDRLSEHASYWLP